MRRMKKKLIVITGLFISGINSSWANNITTIHSESTQIRPLNKYLSQAQKNIVYELNNPNNLSLPSSSRGVLVKTYQKIKSQQKVY